MGWMTLNYSGTAKEYLTDMYSGEENFELVDIAIKNFTTAYLAVRDKKTGYVYAQTYLLHHAPNSYENFGYKPISEFHGPAQGGCPKRILDKLTPLDEIYELGDFDESSIEYAQNWRNRCREEIKTSSRLSKGEIIVTDEPIEFSNDLQFQHFRREKRKWYAIRNYGKENEREYAIRWSGFKNIKFKFEKDLVAQ